MPKFDPEQTINDITHWIRDIFKHDGSKYCAVMYFTGSTADLVIAQLIIKAIGRNNLRCLSDVARSDRVIAQSYTYDFKVEDIPSRLYVNPDIVITDNDKDRRIYAYCYTYADQNNGIVVNSKTLTERWLGLCVRGGSAGGDIAPVAGITLSEATEIAQALHIAPTFIDNIHERTYRSEHLYDYCCEHSKYPINAYIKFDDIDLYIRDSETAKQLLAKEVIDKIEAVRLDNIRKLQPMLNFDYGLDKMEETKNEISHS